MKKPILITIRGNSGAGKTTVSKMLAKKLKYSLIHFDTLEFEMQPGRPNTSVRHELAKAHLYALINNCIKRKENIILEGTLANINKDIGNFDINKLVAKLKRCSYRTVHIRLNVSDKVSKRRMKKRGIIVRKSTYKKLIDEISSIILHNETYTDTDKLTPRQVVNRIIKEL